MKQGTDHLCECVRRRFVARARSLSRLLIVGGALAAMPVGAEFLPQPERVALPSERALLTDVTRGLLDTTARGKAANMVALEAALARLEQPTALRGIIQFIRAAVLADEDKNVPASEAIEESIRLLPGYSGPLLLAADFYAYDDQPGRAADYLLSASRIDPQLVAQIPEYDIDNLVTRLDARQDQRRLYAVSERLLEVGWAAESLAGQSTLVRHAIASRMASGDVAGATVLVPKLLLPSDSRKLLQQNRYRALWPEIERWAGAEMRTQWAVYYAETQAKWAASKDRSTVRAYVRALDSAGHDETIIREMLPLFAGRIDPLADLDLIFVASPLASALARKGRWDELHAMFERASAAWPLGSSANALNLVANRARMLLLQGKAGEGLPMIDIAIADAAKWNGQVGSNALANMHLIRACMLQELDRGEQSLLSRGYVMSRLPPSSVASMHLCFDKPDAAREVLIAALGTAEGQEDVLGYMQVSDEAPAQSEYARTIRARNDALRSDPKLLAAVAAFGRVLPYSMSAGAPAER